MEDILDNCVSIKTITYSIYFFDFLYSILHSELMNKLIANIKASNRFDLCPICLGFLQSNKKGSFPLQRSYNSNPEKWTDILEKYNKWVAKDLKIYLKPSDSCPQQTFRLILILINLLKTD